MNRKTTKGMVWTFNRNKAIKAMAKMMKGWKTKTGIRFYEEDANLVRVKIQYKGRTIRLTGDHSCLGLTLRKILNMKS